MYGSVVLGEDRVLLLLHPLHQHHQPVLHNAKAYILTIGTMEENKGKERKDRSDIRPTIKFSF